MLSTQGFITPPNLPLPQGEEYPPSWIKRGEGGVTSIDCNNKFIARDVHPIMRQLKIVSIAIYYFLRFYTKTSTKSEGQIFILTRYKY